MRCCGAVRRCAVRYEEAVPCRGVLCCVMRCGAVQCGAVRRAVRYEAVLCYSVRSVPFGAPVVCCDMVCYTMQIACASWVSTCTAAAACLCVVYSSFRNVS